ncbi:hypothetical protein PRZ48_013105 [Zasmidium cellare]|uniref:BTB domain-containing protein n=1 Tax=Zasmidium cellare TaxID=395010 RepID=A0ABR0E350_ZASCE|nr:hypothetical protein PRZ48_013105 [Zasmidium cellare]
MADTKEEIIAADGDLVLIVGSEEKRLVVSSASLAAVSPVFKELIGARSSTCQACRQTPTSSKPIEVTLQDDDATAMTHLCQALHLKYPAGLCSSAKSHEFLEFAIVADKYDCSEALLLQSRGLLLRVLDQCTGTDDEKHLWDIVVASLFLRERHSFWRATMMIVMQTSGDLLPLRKARAGTSTSLSALVLGALQQKRAHIRHQLIDCHLVKNTHCMQHTRTHQDKRLDDFASKVMGDVPTRFPPNFDGAPVTKISRDLQELNGLELSCTECDWTVKLDFHGLPRSYLLRSPLCLWCMVGDGRIFGQDKCPGHCDWVPEIHSSSRVDGKRS